MRIDFWQKEREAAEIVEGGLRVQRETTASGKPALKMWNPKATKPFVNAYFSSEEQRELYIKRQIEGHKAHEERKAQYKKERAGTPEQIAAVKIGDIFHYSWGYEQTNCDYFQVIEKRGKLLTLRQIGSKSEPSQSGYSSMSDHRKAVKDAFLENAKPFTKMLTFSGGTPHISMSFGSCSLWKGEANYCSWYA